MKWFASQRKSRLDFVTSFMLVLLIAADGAGRCRQPVAISLSVDVVVVVVVAARGVQRRERASFSKGRTS